MGAVDHTQMHGEVRRVLVAAAEVIFSDGVSETFLDQWADETVFMLSLGNSSRVNPATRPSG